jgi:uncharacterized protein (TIGR02680 family)
MTRRLSASPDRVQAHPHRFRLSRAGVLNVWQYDDQLFDFADGRLLLRGANGAGKSKTLEMLLPFVLDGDKRRMTASGRHHTSLLWLMTDGYGGQSRTGYVWVEFTRTTDEGETEWFTCGIGIRASRSASQATAWYFTSPRRIGHDLDLEDDSGPLAKERCRESVSEDGHFFETPRQYKQHVGETLFGLAAGRYDELLRLLYWLRQPQVGEDIEPGRLADNLSVALPELDDGVVRQAGGTLDDLADFGEKLARRRQAAGAMAAFSDLYSGYARGVAAERGAAFGAAHSELRRLQREVGRRTSEVAELATKTAANAEEQDAVAASLAGAEQRLTELEASPEARTHQRILELGRRADELTAQADKSGRHAATARRQADIAKEQVDDDAGQVRRESQGVATAGQALATEAATVGMRASMVVPSVLVDPALPGQDQPLDVALGEHANAIDAARPLVGELLAAVRVVDEARRTTEQADGLRSAAEREAARLESIAEAERGRLADAQRAADTEEQTFAAALTEWRADDRAIAVEVPDELTADVVPRIGGLAREAARPDLDRLAAAEANAGSDRVGAERSLVQLRERRANIEAERDPAPAPPPLGRSDRSDADGAPLWRLVEFAADLGDEQRAGLEAALESAGLLDAWVRVDGQVLAADRRDVVLPAGHAVAGRSLADLLVVERPDGCPVTAEIVRAVLGRVAVGAGGIPPELTAAVGTDGAWRLGPLTGRAVKPAAQYVGASARAAERIRRLAEVDAQIETAEESRRVAAAAEQEARGRRTSIESWMEAVPPYSDLLEAWADVRARTEAAERADRHAREAEERAEQARSAAVAARRELESLATTHGLPTTEDGLAARREQLRTLEAALSRQVESARRLRTQLARWRDDRARWADLDRQAAEFEAEAVEVIRTAAAATGQHDEARAASEASVRELEERLAASRKEIASATARGRTLRADRDWLVDQHGGAKQALTDVTEQRTAHEPAVVDAAHALAALADVPGLLASALGHSGTPGGPEASGALDAVGAPANAGAYELARGVAPGEKVPADVVGLASSLSGLEVPERPVTAAAVWNRYTEVSSGPAADCEPRVQEYPDALAVVARDESGEYPLGELADRLTAEVERDAELLTQRERKVFEDHILGDLGEALRARRLEAVELVAAMNGLLTDITTSQGVRVSLHWRLRDEVPEDARQAVAMLSRPVGALLPDERQTLRDAMHRLIEASRAEAPELSYTEHLGKALDYREWHAFRVRYTRPELDGQWRDLHRKSPLSQGEQKVVCYLPLFAAAAAHFSSVAGAAPHAPRFVLLDDAFPKIDVRTHPLLFGLLVDLDLDFLITSERLWGDHETVPSLAIYEALRDPSERGIAQYEHRWDGQRLQSVGAA